MLTAQQTINWFNNHHVPWKIEQRHGKWYITILGDPVIQTAHRQPDRCLRKAYKAYCVREKIPYA